MAALQLIKANPDWGFELQNRADNWRSGLVDEGWDRPPGNGPILSFVIGTDEQALTMQKQLEMSGLLSVAIRPPTVPEDTARLRLVLRRDLPNGTLRRLLLALKTQ